MNKRKNKREKDGDMYICPPACGILVHTDIAGEALECPQGTGRAHLGGESSIHRQPA